MTCLGFHYTIFDTGWEDADYLPLTLIDRAIIIAVEKDDLKTNESTIKTAAPCGRCVHFATMFKLIRRVRHLER